MRAITASRDCTSQLKIARLAVILGAQSMRCVLLLHGDAASLAAMQAVLENAQYHVAGSQHGRAAQLLLSANRPACVVVDLHLSDMSGLDVLRNLKQDSGCPPCILITRTGDSANRDEAMRLGALECIEQPFSVGLFLAVVHKATSVNLVPSVVIDHVPAQESYALTRWAQAIVRGALAPRDMPTLQEWGRLVALSKGCLRNWCYTAGLPPRRSLQFMRVLRAVLAQQTWKLAPEDVLDIVDRRTMAKLLILSGGTKTALPGSVTLYLDNQRLILDGRAIAAVRTALSALTHQK